MSHEMTDGIPEDWKAENGMHVLRSIVDRVFHAFAAYDRLVLELFAGPGGMSEGIKLAGINSKQVLGIEWDASACMTAVRAGHPRLHADLTLLDPHIFGKVWGFHSSPSCQGFSMAGKGESRGDTDLLLKAITAMGRYPDRADEILAKFRELAKSPLSSLSLEPLRYILALRPEWFTLEQVRAVLPLWEAYAEVLRPLGYNVWTGVVHAEQYGVPQTRQRAVAMGSLTVDVSDGLVPTHSRFYTHKAKRGQFDEGVLPYVTMAQALERAEAFVVRSNYGTGGDPAARGERSSGEPSAVVTSKVGRNKIITGARTLNSDPKQSRTGDEPAFTVTGSGRNVGFEFTEEREPFVAREDEVPPVYVNGNQANAARRSIDEPAPTIHFGARLNEVKWATHMGDVRNAHGAVRSVHEPAPTMTSAMDNGNFQWVSDPDAMRAQLEAHPERVNNQSGEAFDLGWPAEQPSPTIAGRDLVGMPGANGNRFNGSKKSRNDGVRVTVQEAGILQSFPADYPWTGTLTKQYEQVGNAVPPLLGQAMVETALGLRAAKDEEAA